MLQFHEISTQSFVEKKLPVSGIKSGFWRSKVWSSHLRVCYHTKCLNEKPIREPVRPLHIKVIEYKSCGKLFLHWCQYIIATSLFYYINGHSFKFATSHKNMSPSMPTWLFNAFFIRMNPWKFGEKTIQNWQGY